MAKIYVLLACLYLLFTLELVGFANSLEDGNWYHAGQWLFALSCAAVALAKDSQRSSGHA